MSADVARIEVTRAGARTERTRHYTLGLLPASDGTRTVLVVQNNYTGHAESYTLPQGMRLVPVGIEPEPGELCGACHRPLNEGESEGCSCCQSRDRGEHDPEDECTHCGHLNKSHQTGDAAVDRPGGYTEKQLREAFELVRPAGDWKGRIWATVPEDTDLDLVGFAVLFFTGGGIDTQPAEGGVRVYAPGYYACIGS